MKFVLLFFTCLIAHQLAVGQPIVQQTAIHFGAENATNALINTIPAAARLKADTYTEGNHWLVLWNIVVVALVAWIFLFGGLSTWVKRMADKPKNKNWKVLIYVVLYFSISFLLALPLDIYQNFIRERAYGFSNQNFLRWLSNDLITFLIELVLAGPFFMLIYAVFKKVKQGWWAWGAGISVVFIVFIVIVYPVFITPIFNDYSPLKDGPLKVELLSMARANRVDITQVYVYNESQQTKQFNANVTGIGRTTRIALNDNILNQCTNSEIKAVIGHEMGHYVLNHLFVLTLEFGLLVVFGFWLVKWSLDKLLRKYGKRWNMKSVQDVISLPLLVFLFTFYFFLLTPVTNAIVRTVEIEADNYGLNAAREPDAFASVMIKSADYNKIDPGYWEEFLFFDHPCRRFRIESAMKWKAENLTVRP